MTAFGYVWHFLSTECSCCQSILCCCLASSMTKKLQISSEKLVLPCAANIIRLMLAEEQAKKVQSFLRLIILSGLQVVSEIKATPSRLFATQLDESADVESHPQFMVLVRHI